MIKPLLLEDGQELILLPYSKDELYLSVQQYYVNDLRKMFVHEYKQDINYWDNRDLLSSITRYFMLVYSEDEIRYIHAGRQLQRMVDSMVSDPKVCLLNNYTMNMRIKLTSGFNNYDDTFITITADNIFGDDFFNREDYLETYNHINNIIDNMALANNNELISYLLKKGIIKEDPKIAARKRKIDNILNRKKIQV